MQKWYTQGGRGMQRGDRVAYWGHVVGPGGWAGAPLGGMWRAQDDREVHHECGQA